MGRIRDGEIEVKAVDFLTVLELVHTNASIIIANKIKPAKRMSSLS